MSFSIPSIPLRPSFKQRTSSSSPPTSTSDSIPHILHRNSAPAISGQSTLQPPQSPYGTSTSGTPSAASSHVSILLPADQKKSQSQSRERGRSMLSSQSSSVLPSAMSSHHGSGIGFPRTRTDGSLDTGKYRRKVGFEAFEAGPEALFAFTCAAKSEGYKRSRNTRVFAIAVSNDESGEAALDWLMSELVEDGDEIVAIRVIELDEGERHDPAAQEDFREEASALLQNILEKNNEADDRRISAIVEFVAGRVDSMLLKMIALYRPDSLVVGTKGTRSKLQTWGKALGAPGMGSVSRFAVSHSPVPVIVVRPERKVMKTLAKRQSNPKRGQYAALLGSDGLSLSRSRSRGSISGVSDRE